MFRYCPFIRKFDLKKHLSLLIITHEQKIQLVPISYKNIKAWFFIGYTVFFHVEKFGYLGIHKIGNFMSGQKISNKFRKRVISEQQKAAWFESILAYFINRFTIDVYPLERTAWWICVGSTDNRCNAFMLIQNIFLGHGSVLSCFAVFTLSGTRTRARPTSVSSSSRCVLTLIQCSFVLAPHRLSLQVTSVRSPGSHYHWAALAEVTVLQGRMSVISLHLADVCQRQEPTVSPFTMSHHSNIHTQSTEFNHVLLW